MATRFGGQGRVSTKAKLADELVLLGKVLVRARERSGLKQLEVADRLGLPASYLSKVESGALRLDVIEFLRIAEALNADPAELLNELKGELLG
jgi:transcriptional regulator with XRE-family HTH domain